MTMHLPISPFHIANEQNKLVNSEICLRSSKLNGFSLSNISFSSNILKELYQLIVNIINSFILRK